MADKMIIEVRVISHTPGMQPFVALILDNGTSTCRLDPEASLEAANRYAEGLREGLRLAAQGYLLAEE